MEVLACLLLYDANSTMEGQPSSEILSSLVLSPRLARIELNYSSGQLPYAIPREHPPAYYGLILLASMAEAPATTLIPPSRTVVLGHHCNSYSGCMEQRRHGTMAMVLEPLSAQILHHQFASAYLLRILLQLSSPSPPPALLVVFMEHCFLPKKKSSLSSGASALVDWQ